MIIIDKWTGGLGNNILQLIRAIYYCKDIDKHYLVKYPNHNFLKGNQIKIEEGNNSLTIKDSFFYLSKFGVKDPSPLKMKQLFNEYIRELFLIKAEKTDKSDTLYIHIRSGDIFVGNKCNSFYVQPPLSYYMKCIEKYDKSILVYENDNNPCISKLKENNKITFISNNLVKDLKELSKAKNLVIGFGTFGMLIYFLTEELERIYIPKYCLDELPKGDWGIELIVWNLEGYIKCGEWKNTVDQRRMMLEYKY